MTHVFVNVIPTHALLLRVLCMVGAITVVLPSSGSHIHAQDSAHFEARLGFGSSAGYIYTKGAGVVASGILGWRVSNYITIAVEARYLTHICDTFALYSRDTAGDRHLAVVMHNSTERGLLLGAQFMINLADRRTSSVLPYFFLAFGSLAFKSWTYLDGNPGRLFSPLWYEGYDIPYLGVGAGFDVTIAPSTALFVEVFANGQARAASAGIRVGL